MTEQQPKKLQRFMYTGPSPRAPRPALPCLRAPNSSQDKAALLNAKMPSKPKRPLSAYNLFFARQREQLLAKAAGQRTPCKNSKGRGRPPSRRPKVGFSAMAKHVSQQWKTIHPQEKRVLEQIAELDRARYFRELKVWKTLTKAIQDGAALSDTVDYEVSTSRRVSSSNATGLVKTESLGLEQATPTRTVTAHCLSPRLFNQPSLTAGEFKKTDLHPTPLPQSSLSSCLLRAPFSVPSTASTESISSRSWHLSTHADSIATSRDAMSANMRGCSHHELLPTESYNPASLSTGFDLETSSRRGCDLYLKKEVSVEVLAEAASSSSKCPSSFSRNDIDRPTSGYYSVLPIKQNRFKSEGEYINSSKVEGSQDILGSTISTCEGRENSVAGKTAEPAPPTSRTQQPISNTVANDDGLTRAQGSTWPSPKRLHAPSPVHPANDAECLDDAIDLETCEFILDIFRS